MIKNTNQNIILIIIILAGIFLRFYNLNFDNLWYDEIISFWVTSEQHSFYESYKIHEDIEIAPYTYNLILKFFFSIFGYDVNLGRYLPATFSSLTIITTYFLAKKLSNHKNYILPVFLVSFNIFLISYSQEMRVYSLLIFFGSLSLLFFFNLLNDKPKKKDTLYFFISLLIFISLHIFSLFLVGGFIAYLILVFLKKKEKYIYINFTLSLISIICISYYIPYILNFSSNLDTNLDINYSWNELPKLSFYTNFYFSNFFGSRLVGIIFLISLLFLIGKNKELFLKCEIPLLLLLVILIGYSIPLIFGYLFKPILLPRYVSYLLIFIILLISILTSNLQSRNARKYLSLFLILITLGNLVTEQTIKQFYKKERVATKPEYEKAIKFINQSNFKNYSLKIENMWSDKATTNAINNYISHLSNKNNLRLNYKSLKSNINSPIWIICMMDINEKHCSLPNEVGNFKIIEEKYFNSINLKLVKND